MPAAAVHMAALRGMDVTVLRPEGFALPEPVMARARAAAALSGGSLRETADRDEALARRAGALRQVVGLDARTTATRRPRRVPRRPPRLVRGREWFASAAPDCRFMHCLPVRRNVVVADEVLDGPRSVVVHEAYNRMVAQMAVLHRLLQRLRRTTA